METTVQRSLQAAIVAKSAAPLGADRRELRIVTGKEAFGHKRILTRASVVQVSEDGLSCTHTFSLGGPDGDYSKVLLASEPRARATEKSVRLQHEAALAQHAEATLAEARAHYKIVPNF